MRISDWSSDVCSSDLGEPENGDQQAANDDPSVESASARFAAARWVLNHGSHERPLFFDQTSGQSIDSGGYLKAHRPRSVIPRTIDCWFRVEPMRGRGPWPPGGCRRSRTWPVRLV